MTRSLYLVISLSLYIVVTLSWWKPKPGSTWQWQLGGNSVDTSYDVDMYDIDMFDTPQSTIDKLHKEGIIVICYVDVGTWENWRPDADDFPDSVKGLPVDGWTGERWLDIRQWDILGPIMENRFDLAVNKSCDGIEPDNIDGYSNPTGFPLTPSEQLSYNKNISIQVHNRSMSVGLKNDVGQIKQLQPYFDWALNEQCYQYNECDGYSEFLDNDKAVFGCEYQGDAAKFCPAEDLNGKNISRLGKNLDLDSCVLFCLDYPCNVPTCLKKIHN